MSSTNKILVKDMFKNIVIMSLFSMIILFVCELILRIIPIPGIEKKSVIEFDNDTFLYTFSPNTEYAKWNIRDEFIKRNVNSIGFLDKEHHPKKPPQTFRIGFFGDSFVEARQVNLEDTFFRIIENKLTKYNVETLAFGQSGWGTIHSFLSSKKYSKYFNLDLVVYVFVENDLGDQLREIKKSEALPYANYINNRLIIDLESVLNSRDNYKWCKLKKFLFNHSLLFQNIYRRIRLIVRYGIKTQVSQKDMEMSTIAIKDSIPNQNDLPSTWPDYYKNKAILLGEKVIDNWFTELHAKNIKLAILYVPRESQWKKKTEDQDSWKYWLMNYCQQLNIDFIDPTQTFFEETKKGEKIYDDHFSVFGHQVFAKAFVNWFIDFKRRYLH